MKQADYYDSVFNTESDRYGDLLNIVNIEKVGGNFIFNGTVK